MLAVWVMGILFVTMAVPHGGNGTAAPQKGNELVLAKMQWFFVRTAPTVTVSTQAEADSILLARGKLWVAANEDAMK